MGGAARALQPHVRLSGLLQQLPHPQGAHAEAATRHAGRRRRQASSRQIGRHDLKEEHVAGVVERSLWDLRGVLQGLQGPRFLKVKLDCWGLALWQRVDDASQIS